jgi:hypothetical protein
MDGMGCPFEDLGNTAIEVEKGIAAMVRLGSL